MKKSKYFLLALVLLVLNLSCRRNTRSLKQKSVVLLDEIADGTADHEFSEKYFPHEQTVIFLKQLKDYCDFKDREGHFINDFYETKVGGVDNVYFIYEYYLKCDSARLIIGYRLDRHPELFSFRIESIKRDNPMIIETERRLKF